MRPIKLEINAFGPYKSGTVIDFTALGEKSLFLITGPTGSGKTTILDAICYALFGKTSGQERQGDRMASDFAEKGTEVSVVFEFSLGSKKYKVRRAPSQQVKKKRGEGFTGSQGEAALWEYTSGDWKLSGDLSSTECTERVEALLGLKADQFTQIIMLPQNKFQKFLSAGAKDREPILEALFKTGYYKLIQDALKIKADALVSQLAEISSAMKGALANAEVETEEQLKEKIETQKAGKTGKDQLASEDKKAAQAARKALQEAQACEAKFKELDAAAAELKGIEAVEAEIEDQKKALERADKTVSFKSYEALWQESERLLSKTKEEEAESLQELKEAEAAGLKAKKDLEKAEKAEPRIKDLEAAASKLKDLKPVLKEYSSKAAALEAAQQACAKYNDEAEALKQELCFVEKDIALLETTKDKAGEASKALSAAESQLELEKRLSKSSEKLSGLEEKRKVLKAGKDSLSDSVTKKKAKVEKIEAEHTAAIAKLERVFAAHLAAALEDGVPCPVCGSKEHPKPAATKGALPEDERAAIEARLKEAREELDQENKRLGEAESALAALKATIESEEAVIAEGPKGWRASAGRLETLKDKVAELKAAIKAGETAKEKLTGAKNARFSLEASQKKKTTALSAEREKASGLKAEAVSARQRLPKGISDLDSLEAAIEKTEEEAAQLTEAFKKAKAADKKAGEEHSGAAKKTDLAKSTVVKAAAAAVKQKKDFISAITKGGFSGEKDYEAAKLEERARKDLKKAIDDHGKALASAKNRSDRAKAGVKDLKRPNLAKTTADSEVAEAAAEGSQKILAEAEAALAESNRVFAAVAKEQKEIAKLSQEFAVYGQVANVANGKNSWNLSFQRFVLAGFLDDVLLQASDRLNIMSQGRFSLRRLRELSDGRSAGGLELEVFDSYTGTSRPAANLSGGESFLASLSLALGLSDVAQGYAGGVKMDTIFIDEGFGSLDSDTLDLTMRALDEIRKDGRLVGIISHVQELKTLVETRLEITPGKTGSTAKFLGV
ncbi:MAG: SMC family ATPase [Elusimicrobiota bacterium]|nr:SMC family ATPase [Elusimicrobiota bacterium]